MIKTVIFFLILFISMANASLNIDIDVQDSFVAGETLSFNYYITSDENVTIIYEPYIECSNAPQPFLEQKSVSLEANKEFARSYTSITVDESLEPQKCKARVKILTPELMLKEKEFPIITKPSLEIRLLVCKDIQCNERAVVFVLGDEINLQYSATVKDINTSTVITMPDHSTKKISLPYSFVATQRGLYIADFNASKEGYKNANKRAEFEVMTEQARIKDSGLCNADGNCNVQENYQNCPQDCSSGGRDGYCDKMNDKKCDPDCKADDDYDCLEKMMSTNQMFLFVTIILIVILAVILISLFHGKIADKLRLRLPKKQKMPKEGEKAIEKF